MLISYLALYGFLALISILVKSVKSGEVVIDNVMLRKLTKIRVLLKMMPTGLAAIFAYFWITNNPFYQLGLAGALIFCFFGDFGIDKHFLLGFGLFFVAQLMFAVTFLVEAFTLVIPVHLTIPGVIFTVLVLLYMVIYLNYLRSSPSGLGNYLIPVILYCIGISCMLVSSFLLWLSLNELYAGFIVLGAISFVISDSFLGIHRFHHEIKWREFKVTSTYYLALLLLSLSAIYV
ncbi:MAG: lysoplasmalogenase [Candidatus Heimdallarchaeota archaeon]